MITYEVRNFQITMAQAFGVVDFVDAWDEDLKQASRERFKTYRQLSLEPTYLKQK